MQEVCYRAKTFKSLCREARKRLASDFWSEREEEKRKLKEQSEYLNIQTLFADHLQVLIRGELPSEEVSFRSKVEEIIDNEDDIFNPLKLLMDETAMDEMDYESRQRYVLALSERYLKVRAQIIEERKLKAALDSDVQ
ncbi:MAG: hypothetical protein IJF71_01275 [Clostridia bacterium]|nr:hypothetical protein [Clostridia bacterium]